jgi:hypothetical protein
MGRNFSFAPTTLKPNPLPVNVDGKKLFTHLPNTTGPMLKSNKNGIIANKTICLYSSTKLVEVFERVEYFKF